jgi:hypothetical protein
MPSPLTKSAPALEPAAGSAKPQFLWNEIVRWTLEACILRKEGREAQVSELLQDRLPGLIRNWSGACGLPTETCKQNLRALFRRIQESVETGYIHRRLIVAEVCANLATQPAGPSIPAGERGPVRLRRRVPIDDVSGMLDAVAEAELETRAEAILPMRRAALAMTSLFSGEPASLAVLTA